MVPWGKQSPHLSTNALDVQSLQHRYKRMFLDTVGNVIQIKECMMIIFPWELEADFCFLIWAVPRIKTAFYGTLDLNPEATSPGWLRSTGITKNLESWGWFLTMTLADTQNSGVGLRGRPLPSPASDWVGSSCQPRNFPLCIFLFASAFSFPHLSPISWRTIER